jgi:hypothetical protein
MNHKLKQVTVRASKASESLFPESSSSNIRREAMLSCVHPELGDRAIAYQRYDDQEEERHCERSSAVRRRRM